AALSGWPGTGSGQSTESIRETPPTRIRRRNFRGTRGAFSGVAAVLLFPLTPLPEFIPEPFLGRFLGSCWGSGVKWCVVLTAPRSRSKLLHKRIEQMEVAQPEPKSLEAVLADAEPTLRRFARRLCEDRSDEHDLLQDTFVRACRRGIPQGILCT